jgi:hypothetical protein
LGFAMTLLSALLSFSRRRPPNNVPAQPNNVPAPYDRRGDDRYEAYHPVSIALPDRLPPVAGTVINISLGGAAIRIPGWTVRAPAEWLPHLTQGSELRLTGLIDVAVACWTVTIDAGVLRVRFSREDAVRERLIQVIEKLSPL